MPAVVALRTFAASPECIAVLCQNPPQISGEFFFPGVPVPRYLVGVSCVFTTYQNNLINVAPDTAIPRILDVGEELGGMHCVYTKSRWSLQAVSSSGFWRRLRHNARAALKHLGEDPPLPPSHLDVSALVCLEEFYTPRYKRRLLRELGLS
jgi:hypothetical protein